MDRRQYITHDIQLTAFANDMWLSLRHLVATINTLLQTSTPDALRGRVMSLYTLYPATIPSTNQ